MFRRAEGLVTMEEEEAGEPAIQSEIGTMEGEGGVGSMTGITMIDEDSMIERDRVCIERILLVKIQTNVVGSTIRLQSLHTHPDGTAGHLLLMAALIDIRRDLR